MGFAKEIEDFLNGYKMVSSMAGEAEDRRMRKAKFDKDMADDEAKELEALAIDAEEYLPGSKKAALRRAPKAASTATTAIPDVMGPYADVIDAPEEQGVSMASGGLVPDLEEEEPAALPIDNPVAAKARATGAKSYSAGNGAAKPLVAMNGKARNTYGDDVPEQPTSVGGGKPKSVGPGLKDIFGKADEAIKVAFNSFKQDRGSRSAVGPSADMDLMTGKGAATPAEIKAIDAKIDPDNEMDPWVRGRARLGYAYDFFISRGEPEKAANVAKRLLLFDKMASQTRGKIAMQLLSTGKVEDAARVLSDAYNENVHDGSTVEVSPSGQGQFSFRITKDGEVVSEGTASSQDVAAMAGSVADGSEFVRRTSRIAAGGEGAPGAPGGGAETSAAPASGSPAPAAPALPAAPASPAAPGAEAAPAPADAPAAAEAAPAKKGKRDINWAKKQYQYAASVLKFWEDEAAKSPTPENQARLKDAQIRLNEAEQDATKIRLSTVKSKTADQSQIILAFEKNLADWREAADPLAEAPAPPKDGLRGAPKPAPGGQQAIDPNAPPVTPQGNTSLGAQVGGRKNADIAMWTVPGVGVVDGPPPEKLKKPTPEIVQQLQQALAAGKSKAGLIRKMLDNGFDPTGL